MPNTLNYVENFSNTFNALVERYNMDANTILFIRNDNRAYGYNYEYYRNNAQKINKELDVDEVDKISGVYYKVNNSRESWIDLNKAIKLNDGSLENRIQTALEIKEQRIKTIKIIPECIYTDINGYRYKIMPYDGLFSADSWCKRINYTNLHETKFNINGDDVIVTFPEDIDIRNSFVSLNKYFYPFNIVTKNKIIFKNILDELKRVSTINNDPDSIVFNVKVYTWDKVSRSNVIKPIMKQHDMLYFDRVIGENGILIYNNALYDYDLDFETKKKIKIKGLNPEFIDLLDLNKVRFYTLSYDDNTLDIRKFFSNGIANRYYNRVNFLHPVNNSIILYENLDHEYEVLDLHSIYYPSSIYSVTKVAVERNINSVNFYLRQVGLNDFLPDGTEYLVVEPIINQFLNIINGLEKPIFFDYNENVELNPEEPNDIKLNKIPIEDTIKLYINGVQYLPRKYFSYNKDTKKLNWKFVKSKGGFDLTESYRINITYNYLLSENP